MNNPWQNIPSIFPNYFNETDIPWINRLFKDFEKFIGKSRRELQNYFRSPPSYGVPELKVKIIFQTIDDMWPKQGTQNIDARQLRLELFKKMAQAMTNATSNEVDQVECDSRTIATAIKRAHEIEEGLNNGDIDLLMFSDFPFEQRLQSPTAPLNVREIILNANQSYIRSLLARSRFITLSVDGHARAVIRQIKLKKLLVSAQKARDYEENYILMISGPLSLFRQTRMYARSLSSLLPVLAWSPKFELKIYCPTPRGNQRYIIRSGDPIFPGTTPREFDSKVEATFCKQFSRLTQNWNLLREPAPIAVGNSWIFPDFKLTHTRDPSRQWLLEIVGYWTPEYLQKKIARLKQAKISNLILCVDQTLGVDKPDLPQNWVVIPYKKRVNPKDVLAAIQL